jgi:hypothetical protein
MKPLTATGKVVKRDYSAAAFFIIAVSPLPGSICSRFSSSSDLLPPLSFWYQQPPITKKLLMHVTGGPFSKSLVHGGPVNPMHGKQDNRPSTALLHHPCNPIDPRSPSKFPGQQYPPSWVSSASSSTSPPSCCSSTLPTSCQACPCCCCKA